jgi:5-methylcytosine-specific restriction enzyme B
MNDIDRSVESFDFAMRRRFTWIEITAEQSADNMNLPHDLKEKMAKLK